MSGTQALQRLMTWLSPAFPVGAFAWSAGLETAIVADRVRTPEAVADWISDLLGDGGIRTDAIFCAEAHRRAGEGQALREASELCLALVPARERQAELIVTGQSFLTAARAWPVAGLDTLPADLPYPLAVGALAALHGIGRIETLAAFLTAAVQNQVSVAVRLVPIGQTDGLGIVAALEPEIARLADTAAKAGLDEIHAIAYAQDIAQMQHETLPTRIFRS